MKLQVLRVKFEQRGGRGEGKGGRDEERSDSYFAVRCMTHTTYNRTEVSILILDSYCTVVYCIYVYVYTAYCIYSVYCILHV